jgi:hypothetical protein
MQQLEAASHLPVALLVVVALHQLAATLYGDLTPWLGGGFGMFATLDTPGNRAVSVQLLDADFRREIDIPPGLADAAERALAFPTHQRLAQLAQGVAQAARQRHPATQAVELTVWRLWPTREPIRTARADIDP